MGCRIKQGLPPKAGFHGNLPYNRTTPVFDPGPLAAGREAQPAHQDNHQDHRERKADEA